MKRTRRLEPDEEANLLKHAGPHLATADDRSAGEDQDQDIPISARLAGVLEMARTDPTGKDFEADDYVFGDVVG